MMKLLDRVLALGNLVGHAEMAYIEADNDNKILTWNKGAAKLFGYKEKSAISQSIINLVPIDEKDLKELIKPEKITKSIFDSKGQKIWYDFYITPIVSLKGQRTGTSILIKDISKEIQRDSDLYDYRKQLQEIYEFAPVGIYKADLEGNFQLANSELAWMLGYDSIDLLINNCKNNFYTMFADPERAEEFKYILKETDEVNRFRCQLYKKSGTSLWILSYAKLVKDKENKVAGFNGFAIDISETIRAENALKEANEKLKLLSVQDGLTRIPNRRKFDQYLNIEWARHFRNKEEIAVIICDIDFFKFYNDCYGHQKGDDCLVDVARALKNNVCRAADLAARYGGEEFSVVLPQTGAKGALTVAENLNKCIEALKIPHESSKINVYVTLSVGVSSVIPGDNMSYEDLVNRADEALYEAKQTGRNKAVYKPL